MWLAIDPGTTESAVCIVTSLDKPFITRKVPNHEVVRLLESGELEKDYELVIEGMQSFGMAVGQSTFQTAYWIGYFIRSYPGPHRMLFRQDVKLHICGQTRAKDANIRQALIDRFGNPRTKKDPGRTYGVSGDQWSALAIAVTAIENPTLNRSPF